jgi:4-hydroxybenzoate polyprenyltransferase
MVAVIGIAGFGHVFLDVFDVEEDRILGKANLWAPLTPLKRLAMIVGLLAASILPWLILPINRAGVAFLALEFAMFFCYAVPPLRLKNRGFLGIAADSMYAHVLPALWTWIPFSLLAGSVADREFPAALAIWSFAVGVRHLLQHQVIQLDSDAAAGARTYAVRSGRDATVRLAAGLVLPVEIASFAFLLALIGKTIPFIPAAFLVYVAWQLSKFRFLWLSRLNLIGRVPDAERVTVAGTLVMTRFYERWLPVLLAIYLALKTPEYALLLIVHLILFRSGFSDIPDDFSLMLNHVRSLQLKPTRLTRD